MEFTPITRRTLIKTYCNFCGAMVDVDGDPKERSMLAVTKVIALYRVGPPNFVSTSPTVADAELPPSENVKIFQCCGIDKLAGAISHGQDRLTVALNLFDCCLEQRKLPESAIISEAESLEFDCAKKCQSSQVRGGGKYHRESDAARRQRREGHRGRSSSRHRHPRSPRLGELCSETLIGGRS